MGEEDFSWIPERCANGHQLDSGKGGGVSLSWVHCTCPASSGGGHHVAYCRIIGCRAAPARPPSCPGVVDQR